MGNPNTDERTRYMAFFPKTVKSSVTIQVSFVDSYIPCSKPFAEFLRDGDTVAEYSEGCDVRIWIAVDTSGEKPNSLAIRPNRGEDGAFNGTYGFVIEQKHTIEEVLERVKESTISDVEFVPPMIKL